MKTKPRDHWIGCKETKPPDTENSLPQTYYAACHNKTAGPLSPGHVCGTDARGEFAASADAKKRYLYKRQPLENQKQHTNIGSKKNDLAYGAALRFINMTPTRPGDKRLPAWLQTNT
ncbi:MAG: hypothetical protein ACREXO_05880 [Advenella sp.]